MTTEPQKIERPRGSALEILLVLVCLFLFFRITALIALLALAAFYILYPRHRSRRAIIFSYCFFFAALFTPFDIYVPGFHGPIYGEQRHGPRIIRAVWGMPKIQQCVTKYGEFVAAGCCPRGEPTQWVLVCN